MIIALVHIPLEGPKRPLEQVTAQSLEASQIFHKVEGLNRKYFLNNEDGGGGIDEFTSREAAEAWFNDEWSDWMKSRFGVRPKLTLFESAALLDNEKQEVRVDGAPVRKPWA